MTRYTTWKMIGLFFAIATIFAYLTYGAISLNSGSILIVFFPASISVIMYVYGTYLIKKKYWLRNYYKEKKKNRYG